jgi:hypothetical protein
MLTRDILYVTLSVSVLVAVGMWVWLLVYIIRILRSVEGLIHDFRDRLATIDTILQTIHEKLTSTHAQLSFLAEGVTQIISFINNKRAKRKSSSRASSTADNF